MGRSRLYGHDRHGAQPRARHLSDGAHREGDDFATSSYNFLLTLYENGEFEAIFASGRKGAPLKATVGALAADGKTAVLAGATQTSITRTSATAGRTM